ncbi:unnamed protein product, partial [Ectocarpus sp. 12 AP-2014]
MHGTQQGGQMSSPQACLRIAKAVQAVAVDCRRSHAKRSRYSPSDAKQQDQRQTLASNQLREREASDRAGVYDVLRTTRKKSKHNKAKVAAAVEQQTTVVINSVARRHHRHRHHQHA